MIRTTVQQGAKNAASKVAPQPASMASRAVSTVPQRMVQDELVPDYQRKPHDAAKMLHMRRERRVQSTSTRAAKEANPVPVPVGQSWPQSALGKQMDGLSVRKPNELAVKSEAVWEELRELREALLPPVKPQSKETEKWILGENHLSASVLDQIRLEVDDLFDAFKPSFAPQTKEEHKQVLGYSHVSSSSIEQFKLELNELKDILSPPATATQADQEKLKTVGRNLRQMLDYEKSHIRRVLLTPDHWKKDAEKGAVAFKPTVREPTAIEPPTKTAPADEVLNNEGPTEKVAKELGELKHSVSYKPRHEAIEDVKEAKEQAKEKAKQKAISAWC